MNSVKTAFVSLILLGVLYGMYQVLSTPSPKFDENGQYVASSIEISEGEELTPIDPSEMQLPFDPEQVPPGSEGAMLAEGMVRPVGGVESDSNLLAPPPLSSSFSPGSSRSDSSGTSTTDPSRPLTDGLPASGNTGGANSIPPSSFAPGGAGEFRGSQFQAAPNSPPSTSGSNAVPIGDRSSPQNQSLANPSLGSGEAQNPSAPGSSGVATDSSGRSWPTTRSSREIDDASFRTRLLAAWTLTDSLVEQGKFRDALQELTFFYDDPRLTSDEASALLAWLDGLAAKVIYSTEHLWEDAYVVRKGDTLGSIATAFGISEELLFNINGEKLRNLPNGLTEGIELKVVTGPFRLRVEPAKERITLFVGNCYAGRFEVLGIQGTTQATDLQVVARYRDGKDFEANGTKIPALSPSNPLGRYIIELSDGTMIHEMAEANSGVSQEIGVSGPDAWDLFSILSVGNRVSIQP